MGASDQGSIYINKCSVCGSNKHEWTAHMNQITKDTGFGLWERAEGGFMCGCCNKISSKPTRFCSSCGKWFTGVLAKTEEELFLNDH